MPAPPDDVALSVITPPTQNGFVALDDNAVTAGCDATVASTENTGEGAQPGALTTREYVLVIVGVAVGFCAVVDDRLGPDHVNIVAVPPDGFASSDVVPPTQIGCAEGDALETVFTVTAVTYTVDGLQPDAAPLLTVNEYVLVIVGDTTGFCAAEVNPPGPVHEKIVAPPEGVAVSVTVPTQIGPLFVGAADGIGFTVTIVVNTVVGKQPALLTVNEYVAVVVGVAVGFCAVADDRFGPDHA